MVSNSLKGIYLFLGFFLIADRKPRAFPSASDHLLPFGLQIPTERPFLSGKYILRLGLIATQRQGFPLILCARAFHIYFCFFTIQSSYGKRLRPLPPPRELVVLIITPATNTTANTATNIITGIAIALAPAPWEV